MMSSMFSFMNWHIAQSKEYSHSDKFWKNYIELRDMCVDLGIYEQIPDRKEFCGQHIQDK
jgi:hypothetical protein